MILTRQGLNDTHSILYPGQSRFGSLNAIGAFIADETKYMRDRAPAGRNPWHLPGGYLVLSRGLCYAPGSLSDT